MESIRQWFQDWSDACEYAKECAPDLSFLSFFALGEPYTALLSIAGACFLLWAVNERRIRREAARERAAFDASDRAELDEMFGRMKTDASAGNKLAA